MGLFCKKPVAFAVKICLSYFVEVWHFNKMMFITSSVQKKCCIFAASLILIKMVGFISYLGRSLYHHANLRSRNTALIFGQRKYEGEKNDF